MRYFAELAYSGAAYHGWQSQPRQVSVQSYHRGSAEHPTQPAYRGGGCGRTDAGVHALQYFLHFDCEGELPTAFLQRINKFLPKDIAIYRFIPVSDSAHARFDASHRAYEYRIDFRKNPFGVGTRYYYPYPTLPDPSLMQQAANLLMEYEAFYPFCKSNTDVKNYALRPPAGKVGRTSGRRIHAFSRRRGPIFARYDTLDGRGMPEH